MRGAQIRDGIKVINQYGVCEETLWAYNPAAFTTKPSAAAYAEAKLHNALKYQRVNQDLNSLKQTLASGYPIVTGISVYQSFESGNVAATGMVPMPLEGEQCLGGHAVLIVGYDDSMQCFIMRNSWGTSWGVQGYFYIPYVYLSNPTMASDMWVVTVVK